MKYRYITSQKIIKVSPRMEHASSSIIYANPENKPILEYKDLVIEERPTPDDNQEVVSWFEDGEVITQKFTLVEKERV